MKIRVEGLRKSFAFWTDRMLSPSPNHAVYCADNYAKAEFLQIRSNVGFVKAAPRHGRVEQMTSLGRNRTLLVKFPKTLFSNKLALVLIIRNSTNTLCRHFHF